MIFLFHPFYLSVVVQNKTNRFCDDIIAVEELNSLDLARMSSLKCCIIAFQVGQCLWYQKSIVHSISVLQEDFKDIFDHSGFG